MKNLETKLIFLLLMCFTITSLKAQSTGYTYTQDVEYTYDKAGNRTKRALVLASFAQQAPNQEDEQEERISDIEELSPVEDVVADYSLKIYPNPTKGQIAVEIVNFNSSTNGQMILFDNGGRQIEQQTISGSITYFDLSNHPAGIYILRIRIDENTINWKIIKE